MKVCSKCKEEKSLDSFVKDKRRKDGLSPACRACSKKWREDNKEALLQRKREYYENNKEVMRERNRIKYANNKEKHRKQQVEYYSKPENWVKKILHRTKERAQSQGFEFNLVKEDLFFPELCPILKIKLTYQLGEGQLESNASIDRINSSKGYTKDNVQIISRKANTMKSNSTEEEQLRFAEWVIERLQGTTLERYSEQFKKEL